MSVMRATWQDGIGPAEVVTESVTDGVRVRRLVFPRIPPGSNAIKRMHFHQVARLRAGIHEDMAKLLVSTSAAPAERAIMTLDFRWRTRTKRDPLNFVEGAKAIVDALIGVWIVDDDAAHLEAVVRGHVGTGEPDHVIVTVRDDIEEAGRVMTP